MCFMNQISAAGVAQGEPSCSVEIREPTESVLTGQRTWLECHLQGQWQGLTCTLNGERNRIHSSVGRHKCQLDIMAKTVGTHLVHCTVFCVDGSTNNSIINMTVIGRRLHRVSLFIRLDVHCICLPCLALPCLYYRRLNPADWAASVAQLAEHWTSNPVVMGSNPVQGSSVFFSLSAFGLYLPCFTLL